ncbi:N-acetylglucosamine kinase [Microbacterium pumilum]|uniref:BadF/BadG/BcrA/BcrD ATPase family protein n=1 Tax=Microbacterium pumilum TaxID=344165 RepID=A0ABN2SCG9_9MICO
MTGASVLAIDAGQTGMKVRLQHGSDTRDVLFGGIRTHELLLPQLADVVHAAIRDTGATPEIVTAGISGLTDRDADAGALLGLLRDTGIREAALAHDSTTSFLGALGDTRGAVVAAGTGVVTLAVGRDAVARVDGWGYLMGDAGSGYWIGREALDAVMRAYDGRGPQTRLTDVVRERWPQLDQAYISLQATDDRVSVIASFAASVARLAADGDEVALTITTSAAHQLALSVTTAIGQVAHPDDRLSVCAIGGVFRSAVLAGAFSDVLTRDSHDFDITLVSPLGEGIDGAIALADLGSKHPLSAAVHSARAT